MFFLSQVKRLREADIAVYMIRGNHDAKSKITASLSLRLPDGVYDLTTARAETKVLDNFGVAIHGRGYPKWNTTEDLSLTYPEPLAGYFNIGLLHTCANGRDGHEAYAPCTLDGLVAKGYEYWALGHVHAREVLRQEPWIVFPGNLQGRHAREIGPKGASVVTVEDGNVAVEHHALDDVRWVRCEVDASRAASADDVMDLMRLSLKSEADGANERIVGARVVVRGATAAHAALAHDTEKYRQEIHAAANDLDHVWVEKIKVSTRIPLDLETLLTRDDPVGGLLRSLQALRRDDTALAGYSRYFKELADKLPTEYLQADEALKFTEPATVRALLDEVEAFLLCQRSLCSAEF